MPRKPKRPCLYPGCPRLTSGLFSEDIRCNEKNITVSRVPLQVEDESNWESQCKLCAKEDF